MLNQEEVVYLSVNTIITMETCIFSTAGGGSEVEVRTIVLCVCVCRKRQRESAHVSFYRLPPLKTERQTPAQTGGHLEPSLLLLLLQSLPVFLLSPSLLPSCHSLSPLSVPLWGLSITGAVTAARL